jgi:hypothetical protein
MRRVWAAVTSVWALLAILGVLAWTHPPVQPARSGGANVVVIKGKGAAARAVVLHGGSALAPHTTTHSSPPPGG